MNQPIEVSVTIQKPLKVVWFHLLNPLSIQQWNQVSSDWETTEARVDLKVGGQYFAHMQAKDKSFGFDFIATFTKINPLENYTYVLDDQRVVTVTLKETKQGVLVTEVFDPENENPMEIQREGWQAILTSFKNFVEMQTNH
jgi:uncharacterized protein YndB with AHSA1/START domain